MIIINIWRALNTYLNLYGPTDFVIKVDALSGNGRVESVGNGTGLTLSLGHGNGSASFSGVLANPFSSVLSLTKVGSGTQTLSGTNTYTGITTISAGTLSITGTLGSGNYSGAISNEGVLNINSSSHQILNGIISGAGNLTKTGSGALSLTGNNTYNGVTTVSTGTIGVYHNSALGSSAVSMADSTTLLLGRAVTEVANNISLAGTVTVATDTSVEYLDKLFERGLLEQFQMLLEILCYI
jgi:autotransporter-associated beta strand protein